LWLILNTNSNFLDIKCLYFELIFDRSYNHHRFCQTANNNKGMLLWLDNWASYGCKINIEYIQQYLWCCFIIGCTATLYWSRPMNDYYFVPRIKFRIMWIDIWYGPSFDLCITIFLFWIILVYTANSLPSWLILYLDCTIEFK